MLIRTQLRLLGGPLEPDPAGQVLLCSHHVVWTHCQEAVNSEQPSRFLTISHFHFPPEGECIICISDVYERFCLVEVLSTGSTRF